MNQLTSEVAHHAVAASDCLALSASGESGLSQSEAKQRLASCGPNRLPESPAHIPIRRFLAQFHNVLIYVLLAAAGVTAVLGHFIDTSVIIAVVLVNAIIGFVQEGRAERAMDAIREMLEPQTSVLRDGKRMTIESALVVPGDIVLLEAGEKVPADLRLIQTQGLRIDEAILTGESVAVDKSTEPVRADAPLGDRTCMAFSGALVVAGAARGVAVATGPYTEIGKISGLLAEVQTLTTPLLKQMDRFARWLTVLILLAAFVLLIYGYFVGHLPFSELFMTVVGLSVAAIPEGLPAVLTITMAVGVQAMARRNAIVRRLPAIETLGSVSVICTDKTGTLTCNEMMAASVVAARRQYDVDGDGYAPKGAVRIGGVEVLPTETKALIEVARAAALCNDSVLRFRDDVWGVEGDPMEGALAALAAKIAGAAPEPFADWTRLDSIPFGAERRFMAVLDRGPAGEVWISVKGAPERVLGMCKSQHTENGVEDLDEDYWRGRIDAIASLGQRVLAFATRHVSADHQRLDACDLEGRLVFVGLVGLVDPLRAEAIAAIESCRDAGIRVKMITGDHRATACAIGNRIGLANVDRVLTGQDLDRMGEAEFAKGVVDVDVFARTSPQHKLRLVTALQSHGLTVAMTGDGVNDAPALKRANVGVAMGKKGSAVAKEASEIVLADDNFASIVAAVREGRTVYDNVKKVISWTLPTSAGEAMTIVVALLLGMPLPITAVQILWINLITVTTLGLVLAFEPTEEGTMRRPPRLHDEPLLTGVLIWHIVLVSTLFLLAVFGVYSYAIDRGFPLELARTMSLNTLVVLEIFHLFFIRNIYAASLTWRAARGTRVVWTAVLVLAVAQFAVTYFPPLQVVLGTHAVPVFEGGLIVAVGAVFFALIEVEKQIRLSMGRHD